MKLMRFFKDSGLGPVEEIPMDQWDWVEINATVTEWLNANPNGKVDFVNDAHVHGEENSPKETRKPANKSELVEATRRELVQSVEDMASSNYLSYTPTTY